MSVLVIGSREERQINEAIERARAKPTPWEAMQSVAISEPTSTMMLKDRKPGTEVARQKYPPQQIMLGTYRAAFSFEQQPAGLMRHLSVSSHHRGKVPSPHVMLMVCEAFGFSKEVSSSFLRADERTPIEHPARIWAEEFEPGRMAINVVEVEP